MVVSCRIRWLCFLTMAALLSVALQPVVACADAWDDVQKRGTLIWGADQEGGGPLVFPSEKDPGKIEGFEVELAEMIAQELGVKAEFFQGNWDTLPSLLNTKSIDIVLNGYELTPTRQRDFLCTVPYYCYGLQLLAAKDSPVKSWDDLKNKQGPKRSVGALIGSAALIKLESDESLHVRPEQYEGNTPAMNRANTGSIDATLQDDCIAVFYAPRYANLVFIGEPVDLGYYVALVGKDEARLHEKINAAIAKIIADGRMRTLYDRWELKGARQEELLKKFISIETAKKLSFGEILQNNLPILLQSAGMTLILTFASMPLAIGLGILLALGRLYAPAYVRIPCTIYVEVIRGTPLMLQLFAIFYIVPELGIPIHPLVAAITGLALNYAAYEAEIYRAGLQAIPRGQMEAALALGMSRGQAIRRIILPQAFRIVIPPVTNDFIAMFKDTSVCSVVTVVELTKRYSVLAQSTNAIIELAIVTSILYLLMSYPLSLFTRWSEKRFHRTSAHG